MTAGSGARGPEAAGSADTALARLADEQAALRRVARLVTQGAAPAEIFAAVAREVGTLVHADVVHLARYEHDGVIVALAGWAREGETLPAGTSAPYRGRNISADVLRTRRPVRIDDYGKAYGVAAERVRSLGLSAGVGAPIVFDGRVWGVVVASSKAGPLPRGTEERIAGFTELVASALTSAASQDQWRRLTHEPAALERVATLVARAAPADELLPAVTAEIGTLLRAESAAVVRYQDDGEVTALAVWSATADPPATGGRWTIGEGDLWTEMLRRRGPSSTSSSGDPGPEPLTGAFAAGCPVVVDGEVWGALSVHAAEPLPPDGGARLSSFAELVAAAVGNDRARTEARRLADEQAALRRVATLVARERSADDVFDRIAHEIRTLLNVEDVRLGRYDGDVLEIVAMSGPYADITPTGTRVPLTSGLAAAVRRTRRPQRLDGDEVDGGAIAAARSRGYRTIVAVPLTVHGELWGVLIAGARRVPFERGIEGRLAEFAELMELAVANLQARETLGRVLGQQEALRRVATLVARGTSPEEMFATVAREVGEVLGADAAHLGRFDADRAVVSVGQWGDDAGVPIGSRYPLDGDSVSARVLSSGQSARMDAYDDAGGIIAATVRGIGIRSAIGVPISLEGRPWGVMIVSSKAADPFPADTESRLQSFTDLVATAISNASARTRIQVLADEQAALRRVATLVARGAPPAEVFDAVVEELGLLLDVESTGLVRFEDGEMATVVAGWGRLSEVVPVGARLPLGGTNVVSQIARTGRPARMEDYPTAATGAIAEQAQRLDTQASVGGPVVVAGRLWGAMVAAALGEGSLPEGTETRLEQFTELIGTAIANTDARVELGLLADEQAALRRVATLVAHEAPAAELLAKVAEEAAGVFGDMTDSAVLRYEPDDTATVAAVWGKQPAGGIRVGGRMPIDGSSVTARVFRERRPVRIEDYAAADGAIADHARAHAIRSAIGCPIITQGRLWGAMVVARYDEEPFPPDAERRVQQFTDLAATAIANADSRDQLEASRARVLTAGDEARRRLVRDLHDGAQQRLVQAIISLKLARRAFVKDGDDADALLADALDHAEQGNLALRELAHGILPSVLTRGGLRAGVDSLVVRLDLPVEVDVTAARLPRDIEANAYFIVAEALTNVVKHAQATRAEVVAAIDDGMLRVEVRDDGVGGADAHGHGHGLLGIGDRAAALGGRLEIVSPRGRGTVVTAELPLG